MSYCIECGSELPTGEAKFCPNCGCKQQVVTSSNMASNPMPISQTAPSTNVPPRTSEPRKKKSGNNPVLAIFGVIAMLIGLYLLGIPGDVLDSTTYSPGTPEGVFEIYYKGFKNVNEDAIWGVLSSRAKADVSKDIVYNTIYVLKAERIKFTGFSINSVQTDGNIGRLSVSIAIEARGYKVTQNKEIPMVRENGVWKIDDFVVIV